MCESHSSNISDLLEDLNGKVENEPNNMTRADGNAAHRLIILMQNLNDLVATETKEMNAANVA